MEKLEATPRKAKTGWIKPLSWGLLLVCWSAYNIHHGVRSASGWIWNTLLIAIAALNFLVSALAFFGNAWLNPSASAKRLAGQQQQLYGTRQVYRNAEPDDFRLLDKAFYAVKSEELESLGFHKMREVVNVTASNAWPKNHAVIRGFLDPTGTIYASIYDLRIFGFVRLLQFFGVIARKMKTVECESELSDGTYVTTSNTKETNKTIAPPFMNQTRFPADTDTKTIVANQQKILASTLASKPVVFATVCRNNDDVQALQDRMHSLKSAYRLSPGFDRRAEWENIAGRELREVDEETLAHFKAEMDSTADKTDVKAGTETST